MTPTFNEILREAVFGTLSDRRGLLGYGVPASALLAAASTMGILGGVIFGIGGVIFFVAFRYCAMIALVIISFYWQRRYLLGPGFDSARMKLLNGYFWRAVLFYGIFYSILSTLDFMLSFPLPPEDYRYNDNVVFDENTLLLDFAFCSLAILSARFLLVFPSIAVGRPISWRESWKLAGNRGFHLGIVIVLLHTPFLAFEYVALFALFAFQDSTAWIVAYSVVSSFLEVLATLMALVASAFLYKSTTRTIIST